MTRNAKGHGSSPRITRKTAIALNALLSGEAKTVTEAARIAGLSREHFSKTLHKPHVSAEIERRVRQRLSTHGMLAASASLEQLARDADSEYVKADVSKHILSINGVKPATDAAQGSTGGIAFRLVVGGQAVDIAAVFGPSDGSNGAQSVQISEPMSQPIDMKDVTPAAPYLGKVGDGEEGGRG